VKRKLSFYSEFLFQKKNLVSKNNEIIKNLFHIIISYQKKLIPMNFDFLDICQKNQINNVLIPNLPKYYLGDPKDFVNPNLQVIKTDKKVFELEYGDLNQIQLVWLDCSNILQENFETIMTHILGLGVSWVWIPSLRLSDHSGNNFGFNPKKEIFMSFKDMILLMEKSMYSIHWSKSTYEESVKSILLKKY